jgi:hypothetical protein
MTPKNAPTLKVYMELGSYFLFLQEQIKDIIIMCSLGLELKKYNKASRGGACRERLGEKGGGRGTQRAGLRASASEGGQGLARWAD